MLAWGLSGVVSGKVLTKSYGVVDGKRTYYRFVSRSKEPVWFWTLCSLYMAIGIATIGILYFIFRTQAVSG